MNKIDEIRAQHAGYEFALKQNDDTRVSERVAFLEHYAAEAHQDRAYLLEKVEELEAKLEAMRGGYVDSEAPFSVRRPWQRFRNLYCISKMVKDPNGNWVRTVTFRADELKKAMALMDHEAWMRDRTIEKLNDRITKLATKKGGKTTIGEQPCGAR